MAYHLPITPVGFHLRMRSFLAPALLGFALLGTGLGASQQVLHFNCAPGTKGAHVLSASTLLPGVPTPGAAFGFDLKTAPSTFSGAACASDKPFFFSVEVPDGNYRVSLVLGGPAESVTTVRAESRRLFVLERTVAAGGSGPEEFLVNVRTPSIGTAPGAAPSAPRPTQPASDEASGATPPPAPTSPRVKLKPREIGALDWDNKLTLEFNGEHPAVRSITITPAPNVPTLYLAGDSTVVDQDKEPWAAWGQMLPVFFGPRLAVANNAESGETIRSFVGERRLDKVMSTIKSGDYLMIQFAHNDQKQGNGFVSIPDYKTLLRRYIADARGKGATPILVTSMNRRKFDAEGHIVQTLGDYPSAMREVAVEQHVALIDLNAMSKTLFEAMGEQGTLKAFVHYPANTFPDQPQELHDDTHFNSYGAYELAECIVQSIRDQKLPIAQYLRQGIPAFDPAHPDPVATFHIPPSPMISTDTPYGR
jgi:lysophospholipase L1-like esterase